MGNHQVMADTGQPDYTKSGPTKGQNSHYLHQNHNIYLYTFSSFSTAFMRLFSHNRPDWINFRLSGKFYAFRHPHSLRLRRRSMEFFFFPQQKMHFCVSSNKVYPVILVTCYVSISLFVNKTKLIQVMSWQSKCNVPEQGDGEQQQK